MTVVNEIFNNWEIMSTEDFNEYMLNNKKTLIREEYEQIKDAFIQLDDHLVTPVSTFKKAWEYYHNNYTQND
jgi:predicted alpha/beta-fold hydrolase